MPLQDDEFDLDVRVFTTSGLGHSGLWAPGQFHPALTGDEIKMLPDTMGMDCQTVTCPEETCGCNTNETCVHACANPDAITFGDYCEDASGGEDTCSGCPPGPDTSGCGDDG